MPTRILSHREASLAARFDHLREEISRFEDHPIQSEFQHRFDRLQAKFEQIDTRRSDVEANPASDALHKRYLKIILATEADIEELELVITHLDQFAHYQERANDRVNRAIAVCDELCRSLNIEAEFLPVLSENYALLPLLGSDFYVVYVPRGSDIVPTTPIFAHEVAHALLDRQPSRSDAFNQRFRELRQRMDDDRTERDFYENWSQWYDELFCDVVGFYTFGPSYLSAQCHHLMTARPYHIHRDVGIRDDTLHPPDALRIDIVADLAESNLPTKLLSHLEPIREEFARHLERYRDEKPSFYDDWTDDQLVEAVIGDARSVTAQFDQLNEYLSESTNPGEAPEFEYRIKANQYWLNGD